MRFVDAILDKDGLEVDSLIYCLSVPCSYKILVQDSELGLLPSYTGYDCIGRGLDFAGGNGVVVKHTIKTAMLHDYINIAETRVGVKPFNYKLADQYLVNKNYRYKKHGNYILDIRVPSGEIALLGESGSCVVWTKPDMGGVILCTLYDFLVFLCHISKMNVMKYETIQIGSRDRSFRSTIRLLHTPDANRYFTKMWVDVGAVETPLDRENLW